MTAQLEKELEDTKTMVVTLKTGEPRKFKFSKRKDQDERVDSPTYTFPNGYHIGLRVIVYGYANGKGTHV